MPKSDMEFEYHVQFPKPRDVNGVTIKSNLISNDNDANNDINCNGAGKQQKDVQEEELIWPIDSNIPGGDKPEKDLVVILFGWAGSKHQYLTKYSDIYLQRGCIVLRYITPVKLFFADVDKLGTMTSQLVHVLKDLQLETHPIFFHVFSNGGGLTYSSFLREMAIEGLKLDIRGTIFDSAPAPRSMVIIYKALVNIYAEYNWFRYVMAGGVVLLIIFGIFWYHIKTAFRFCLNGDKLNANGRGGTISREDGPSQNWLSRISNFRHHNFLFIYSEVDELIAYDKVEQFASILAKRQNHIKYLKFTDSPHVKHYLLHPREYVDSIVSFIRGVMSAGPNKTQIGTDH